MNTKIPVQDAQNLIAKKKLPPNYVLLTSFLVSVSVRPINQYVTKKNVFLWMRLALRGEWFGPTTHGLHVCFFTLIYLKNTSIFIDMYNTRPIWTIIGYRSLASMRYIPSIRVYLFSGTLQSSLNVRHMSAIYAGIFTITCDDLLQPALPPVGTESFIHSISGYRV